MTPSETRKKLNLKKLKKLNLGGWCWGYIPLVFLYIIYVIPPSKKLKKKRGGAYCMGFLMEIEIPFFI